jgi:hypothetical protein
MGHPTSQAQLHRRNFTGATSQAQLHRRNFTGATSQAQLHRRSFKGKEKRRLQYCEQLNQEFLAPAVTTLLQEAANRVYNARNSSQVPSYF